ncbi:hypothetical protein [Paludisphaera sp.]|uniref:hypothetical protein n=1 Tax=Paludisphaera sp. TaxID=2017432 RepID=UPI00301D3FD5
MKTSRMSRSRPRFQVGRTTCGRAVSSRTWPRNVAFAGNSTSTNDDPDCRGIARSFSERCRLSGAWTSMSGTPKTTRRAARAAHRHAARSGPAGRRVQA